MVKVEDVVYSDANNVAHEVLLQLHEFADI